MFSFTVVLLINEDGSDFKKINELVMVFKSVRHRSENEEFDEINLRGVFHLVFVIRIIRK